MKRALTYILAVVAVFCSLQAKAQDAQKEKTPEEVAIEEAERLETELNLNATQLFYVDSTLRYNYTQLKEEFDAMKARGGQDYRSYEVVREKWIQKNLDAFKVFLDDQQYIRYLKLIGKGKDYKKGKDGKFYKKEPKKESKKKDSKNEAA